MDWLTVLSVIAPALVIGYVLMRLKRAGSTIDLTIDEVEQWLASQGFERVGRWRGWFMTSALQMVRQGAPEMGFYLGRRAIQQDRPDRTILGRTDSRFLGCWWLHVGVALPAGKQFPVLAMRRSHPGTSVAWNFIKPTRWEVVRQTTGDDEFDALFEIWAEDAGEHRELLDEDTRAAILGLKHDPYFDNLLFLVSPHRTDYLTVVNPPLPSAANPTITAIAAVARKLAAQ